MLPWEWLERGWGRGAEVETPMLILVHPPGLGTAGTPQLWGALGLESHQLRFALG